MITSRLLKFTQMKVPELVPSTAAPGVDLRSPDAARRKPGICAVCCQPDPDTG
jgi:hypothetical protein